MTKSPRDGALLWRGVVRGFIPLVLCDRADKPGYEHLNRQLKSQDKGAGLEAGQQYSAVGYSGELLNVWQQVGKIAKSDWAVLDHLSPWESCLLFVLASARKVHAGKFKVAGFDLRFVCKRFYAIISCLALLRIDFAGLERLCTTKSSPPGT
ncbi:hypothetical protein ASPACDRAFT_46396 [Aspergillus aculeatus ATCC 16872]|uniref:Uncharacterized protein n=1 Tax=Aspergillus aculeatus (strain ATCC 16872 / CBS 172.66 / WB 5094) TaxID=690307 RepID=A0A1L9WL36_ASPA1|nr:uncharacterized protein ASPACDRAFT_46396 [Aspergillus aculeatus ATCC 16872]OJJ96868.1 hypothetical protein ASPACDRAFT_46396 [Aspergillus aculeatus ATCC 16872]